MGTEKSNSFQHSIPKFDSAASQTFLDSRKILKSIRTWDGFPPVLWQVQTWPQPQIGNHLWQSSLLEQALIILPSCLHSRDPSWHWGWVWVPSATVHQVIPQANNSLRKRSRVIPKLGNWGMLRIGTLQEAIKHINLSDIPKQTTTQNCRDFHSQERDMFCWGTLCVWVVTTHASTASHFCSHTGGMCELYVSFSSSQHQDEELPESWPRHIVF